MAPRHWSEELANYLRPFKRYPPLADHATFLELYAALLATTGPKWMRVYRRVLYGNVRLIVPIACEYLGRGIGISDLMQEGLLGLEHALTQYDEKSGFRFSTYAIWWIRARIRRAVINLNERHSYREPVHLHHRKKLVRRVMNACQLEGTTWPDVDDVVRRVHRMKSKFAKEMSRAMIAELMQATMERSVPLDAPAWENGDASNADVIADLSCSADELLDFRRASERLRRLLDDVLTPTEAHIVRRRFGIDGAPEQTLRELGTAYGLSRERIRQIEERALRKLKTVIRLRSDRTQKEFVQSP